MVVEAEPREFEQRLDFGELLLRYGRAREALETFEAALAVEPGDQRAVKDRDWAKEEMSGR